MPKAERYYLSVHKQSLRKDMPLSFSSGFSFLEDLEAREREKEREKIADTSFDRKSTLNSSFEGLSTYTVPHVPMASHSPAKVNYFSDFRNSNYNNNADESFGGRSTVHSSADMLPSLQRRSSSLLFSSFDSTSSGGSASRSRQTAPTKLDAELSKLKADLDRVQRSRMGHFSLDD